MKNLKIFSIIVLSTIYITCMSSKSLNDSSNQNYVPNEETAIKIAEAIWYPIYGNKIEQKKPFKAYSKDSLVWIVEGTLEKGEKGGVPYIEIQKSDCKILKVTHGK
jgi:hypothetical protein